MTERLPRRTNLLFLMVFVLVYLIFEAVQIPMYQDMRKQVAKYEPTTECYHRSTRGEEHFASFADFYNRKNTTHYSPISPSYHQALIQLSENQIINGDGKQVTFGNQRCNERKMRTVTTDTPIRERALCKFEYMLNYNSKRLPAAFTEAKCVCERPNTKLVGRRIFKCEELKYHVRTLMWDEDCQAYKEHLELISLACLPVIEASAPADGDVENFKYTLEADVPTKRK